MFYFKNKIFKLLTAIVITMVIFSLTGCSEKIETFSGDNDESSIVSKGVNLDDLGNIVNGQYYFDDGTNEYYSSFDKNSSAHIYKKNKSTGNTETIFDGFGWSFVIRDGWLYFSGNAGATIDGTYNLFRMKLDGSDLEHLNSNFCYSMHFYNNWLYYLKKSNWEATTSDIYRSSVDGKNEEQIVSGVKGYSIVHNNKLYYLGSDSYVYEANPDGTNKKQLLFETVQTFVIGQGKIIYIDSYYNIKVSKIDGTDIKTIKTNDGKLISNLNSYKDTIFYVKYNSSDFDYTKYGYTYELFSMKIDGTNDKKIYQGTSWGFYINAVTNKLFVLDYANDATTQKITAVAKNMNFDGSELKELYR